jgi:hypothetical protein
MDSILKCILSGARGFLLLRPVVQVFKTNATRGSKRAVLILSWEAIGHI